MRLFVGIALAETVVGELAAVCARLRKGGDGLRWAAPESWHITLQFLGNTSAAQYDCLRSRLAQVRSEPVPVRLAELGVFERAGVFFAEVELTAELVKLQKRVAAETARCGFAAEERAFHPHLTLARAKGDGRSRQLRELKARAQGSAAFPAFVAREFLLYESHLGAGGARYEVRGRFELASQRVGEPASQQ